MGQEKSERYLEYSYSSNFNYILFVSVKGNFFFLLFYKIRNMLRTTYGQQLANSNDKTLRFFGASDVDDLVSQTATSRYNYDIATTRGAKILSFASGVMSLVQIGQ